MIIFNIIIIPIMTKNILFLGDILRYQRSKLDSIFLVAVADHSVIDSCDEDKDEVMKQVKK